MGRRSTLKLSLEIPGQRRKLGEILIEEKLVTEEVLDAALKQQKVAQERLGTLLMRMGVLTPTQFMRALSKQLTLVHRSLAKA
jgi:hypothetical protein